MKISVRTFPGESVTLDVEPEDTMKAVKYKISKILEIDGDFRLIVHGCEAGDNLLVRDYDLSNGSHLQIVMRLMGGGGVSPHFI